MPPGATKRKDDIRPPVMHFEASNSLGGVDSALSLDLERKSSILLLGRGRSTTDKDNRPDTRISCSMSCSNQPDCQCLNVMHAYSVPLDLFLESA